MVDFASISIGRDYSRQTLAELWGYKSMDALRRGVVTPAGLNVIIFFVTKEKSQFMTKYEDHIDRDILFWEGENAHGSDKRILLKKDIIHVFYREFERTNFRYEGKAILSSYQLLKDRPSKFTFQLIDRMITDDNIVEEVRQTYGLSQTEKEAIIKSRRGQGVYRTNVLNLWKTCSVTGFSKNNILIASHIKPWKFSSNEERLSPYNSLLLIPTIDKLFDKGFVGFSERGKIMLSSRIESSDWKKVGLNKSTKLRDVPSEVKPFLGYHSEYVFDLIDK